MNKYTATVCLAALMALSATPALSQAPSAQSMESQMKTQEAAAPQARQLSSSPAPAATTPAPAATGNDLPVPTGNGVDVSAMSQPAQSTTQPAGETTLVTSPDVPTTAAAADPTPAGTTPANATVAPPPTPILTASNPEQMAGPRFAGTQGMQSAANTDRITNLRDAVAVGVLTHPQTEAVENNRRATDEELNQAQALYLPSIDARADAGYQYSKIRYEDIGSSQNSGGRAQIGVTLTQMLFDGFETQNENRRQEWRVRSASHRVRETAEFLGLDIVEAYIDILRQRELVAIAVENTAQHQDILGQIQDATSAGRSTGADVEQTHARLAAAKATESNARQALRDAETNFRTRVGDLPQSDIETVAAPRELLEANVEDQVKQTLTHSPTLDISEADVHVASYEGDQSGASMYPQLDLQLNGNTGENVDTTDGRSDNASALVVANWNLYRGGGDIARQREFTYRHAQSKSERNNTARAVERDVRQTWTSMIASSERAAEFGRQAEANAAVVQAYKDQFNLDRRTLLDVLDAQNEWFISRTNAINNFYLNEFAVFRLIALKGDLLPTLQIAYPKEVNPADTSDGIVGKKS